MNDLTNQLGLALFLAASILAAFYILENLMEIGW